jgi:hypothetical protein
MITNDWKILYISQNGDKPMDSKNISELVLLVAATIAVMSM